MSDKARASYHRRFMTLQERLDDMRVVAPNGCWIWTGSNDGYGRITINRRVRKAHVVSYELNVGRVPAGLELDHLCREPLCINWRHLEPVTHRENMLRAPNTFAGSNAAKTYCKYGHSLDDARLRGGRRLCRVCEADYRAKYNATHRDTVRQYSRDAYYRNLERSRANARERYHRVLLRKRAPEGE